MNAIDLTLLRQSYINDPDFYRLPDKVSGDFALCFTEALCALGEATDKISALEEQACLLRDDRRELKKLLQEQILFLRVSSNKNNRLERATRIEQELLEFAKEI